MLFTNSVTALFTLTTSWNIKAELFVSIALAAWVVFLLTRMFDRDAQRARTLALAPVFSILVFSLRQNENWLRSAHNCWFFLVVFVVAALSAVQRGKGRRTSSAPPRGHSARRSRC